MPGWLSSFDLATHGGWTLLLLVAGAFFWLADGYLAERADIQRELPFDAAGIPQPDQDRSDRDQFRERATKTARRIGKWLVAAGLVMGLALMARVFL